MKDNLKTKAELMEELTEIKKQISAIGSIPDYSALEKALKKSELKYKLLMEDSPLGIFKTSFDGKILEINSKCANMFGYNSVEDFCSKVKHIGKDLYVYPDKRKIMLELLMQAKEFLIFESEFKRRNGSIFTGYIVNKIIRDKSGKPKNIFGFLEDITDRKKIENKLYETNSILDAIFQGSAVSIYIKDIMGKYIMMNSACLKLLNKTLRDIVGKDDRAIFSPAEAKNIMHLDRKIIMSGEPVSFEETIEINNKTYNLLTTKSLYCDSMGKVVGLVGVSIDITHLKKAEQAQRISEARYKTLIENIPEAIFNADTEGIITYVSPAIEKLTKYNVSDLVNKPFTNFIHSDDVQSLIEDFKNTLNGHLKPAEFRLIDKDGEIIYVRTKSQPTISKSNVTGLSGIVSNITQLKITEEKFTKAFHSSSNLMVISEFPELRFIDINKTFLNILGFKKEEVIGKTAKELNIIFDYNVWNDLLKVIENNTKISSFEIVILNKAGDKRLVKFSGELFILQGIKYLLCEMNDITELRTAEEKKNNSLAEMKILSETAYGFLKCNTINEIHSLVGEKIMDLLQKNAYVILSDRDESSEIVYVTKLFGFEKLLAAVTNLIGKDPQSLTQNLSDMTEEEVALYSTNKLEALPGGIFSLSTRKIPKTICHAVEILLGIKTVYVMGFIIGDKHYGGVSILHKKESLLNHKAHIETIINQASVVIHRKKIEEFLIRSEERYKEVIENSYEAIFVVQDYNIVYANPKTSELSGYSAEELSQKPVSELIINDDYSEFVSLYNERIDGLNSTDVSRLRCKNKLGDLHWCQFKAARMIWDGKPAMLVFSLDITEQIKTEQELEHRNKIEVLVNNMSSHFLKIPNDKFENEIERDLTILGDFVGVERCMMAIFSDDQSMMENYTEWVKPGIPNIILAQRGFNIENFVWSKRILNTDNYIYIPKLSELPEEAKPELDFWHTLNCKSILIFSLFVDSKLAGYFGFSTQTFEREWSNHDILLLQLISDVFSNALKRHKSELNNGMM